VKNKNRSKVSTCIFVIIDDELFFCSENHVHGVSKAFLRFSEICSKKKFQISKYFWRKKTFSPPLMFFCNIFNIFNIFPPKYYFFNIPFDCLNR